MTLTVDRDEGLGADDIHKRLDLFLSGMTRDVHMGVRTVEDVGPGGYQIVDDPRHLRFVTRDCSRRNNDRVAGFESDVAVLS